VAAKAPPACEVANCDVMVCNFLGNQRCLSSWHKEIRFHACCLSHANHPFSICFAHLIGQCTSRAWAPAALSFLGTPSTCPNVHKFVLWPFDLWQSGKRSCQLPVLARHSRPGISLNLHARISTYLYAVLPRFCAYKVFLLSL
jgi:hypothetical protein